MKSRISQQHADFDTGILWLLALSIVVVIASAIMASLKLVGIISWSWWPIFAMLWLPAAVMAVLLGFLAVASVYLRVRRSR